MLEKATLLNISTGVRLNVYPLRPIVALIDAQCPSTQTVFCKDLQRKYAIHGKANPAFAKPRLCLGDARHFVIFVVFGGLRSEALVFSGQNAFVIFAIFVETAPFWQGTKTRFTKNTVSATPNYFCSWIVGRILCGAILRQSQLTPPL